MPSSKGAIQGTSRESLYKELGLESLTDKRWVRKLTFFCKIVKGNSPQYLSSYLKGNNNFVYNTRSASQILLNTFRMRTEKFKNSFFPFCIFEWYKLSNLTKQSENKNLKIYQWKISNLMNDRCFLFTSPKVKSCFLDLKLNFSHLNEHNFRHNFKVCVSPMCGCGSEIESTQHFSCVAIFIMLKDRNSLIASTT